MKVKTRRQSRATTKKQAKKEEEETEAELMDIDDVEKEAESSSSSEDEEDNNNDDQESEEEDDTSEEKDDDNDESESDDSEGEEDDDDDDEEEEDEEENTNNNIVQHQNNNFQSPDLTSENCTFDLRNLVAVNNHEMDIQSLYATSSSNNDKEATKEYCITRKPGDYPANEDFLLKKASESCQQLIAALWILPKEQTDVGPLVTLPPKSEIPLPRALPPPKPKEETKWQKFAKERGIAPKSKRSRKVFDELTGDWKFLTGKDKANDKSKEWPIMEVKGGDDPYADPWEKLRDVKRKGVDKNMESRMRNEEREGLLKKGTTTRFMKGRKESREKGKEAHAKGNQIPSGVPVDIRPSKKALDNKNPLKRGMELTQKALVATQRSTASLGKFDKMIQDEPERKQSSGIRKRKFEPVADNKVIASEKERGLKILDRVMKGGKQKDRDVRKGKYARGETAYDYDYDDGLGASSFRKKKGRAGAGKAKKVTKKRAK